MVAGNKTGVQFLHSLWWRPAARGHNLVPLSQKRRLRADAVGVCFASRTGRSVTPARPALRVLVGAELVRHARRQGKAVGFHVADGFALI